MTAIAKLIKIHSFQLDEKRRELKNSEDQAAKIEDALANLINQVEAEKKPRMRIQRCTETIQILSELPWTNVISLIRI